MKRILVVDDQAIQCERIREAFRTEIQQKLLEVDVAYSGKDGLEKLKLAGPWDVLFCDLYMPEMDGLQMLENYAKEVPVGSKRPLVIMVTTETSAPLKEQGKSLGVVAWVSKPVDPVALAQVVRKKFLNM
jgi:two-component system chemotaxis response regulator CheY